MAVASGAVIAFSFLAVCLTVFVCLFLFAWVVSLVAPGETDRVVQGSPFSEGTIATADFATQRTASLGDPYLQRSAPSEILRWIHSCPSFPLPRKALPRDDYCYLSSSTANFGDPLGRGNSGTPIALTKRKRRFRSE